MQTLDKGPQRRAMRAGWPPHRTLWFWLLLGWTVSAADRALTGPVVTWMIGNDVGFLADADKPYALGGLIGGLFFAGYMLTQWPGGYLGDRYGHRTMISVSLVWAGIATLLSGVITGLVLFIAIRVLTGLGEGAFYSNDRSLIAEKTPIEKRSLGMGVVITGLAFGITIATVFAPNMIELGGKVFAAGEAWRMPFLILGTATLLVGLGITVYFRGQERGQPYARAALHLGAYAAGGLARSWPSTSSAMPPGSRTSPSRSSRWRSPWRSSSGSSRARATSSGRSCARAT
jgi:MFS transporter, ACS family, D-galactonate transporter